MRQKPFEIYLFFGIMRTFHVKHFKTLLTHWQFLIQVAIQLACALLQHFIVHMLPRAKLCLSQKPQTRPKGQAHCCSFCQEKEKTKPPQRELCGINIHNVSMQPGVSGGGKEGMGRVIRDWKET